MKVFWITLVPGPLVIVVVTYSPLVEIVHDDRLAYTGKFLILKVMIMMQPVIKVHTLHRESIDAAFLVLQYPRL